LTGAACHLYLTAFTGLMLHATPLKAEVGLGLQLYRKSYLTTMAGYGQKAQLAKALLFILH